VVISKALPGQPENEFPSLGHIPFVTDMMLPDQLQREVPEEAGGIVVTAPMSETFNGVSQVYQCDPLS